MSKRQLTKFLEELDTTELKDQIVDLYMRYKPVKEFYDFSFNPNEEKLIEEAKLKISKEYFPQGKRKAKKRRSVAHKQIIHLQKLAVDPCKIADLMLYNIEIAQAYNEGSPIKQEAFYKSIYNSYCNALDYIDQQLLHHDFILRVDKIIEETEKQDWFNKKAFEKSKASLFSSI